MRSSEPPGAGEQSAGEQAAAEQSAGEHSPVGHDADKYGERAETYLRLLAETALRLPEDPRAGRAQADRVQRAAQVLVEAGVVTDQVVHEILTDLQLALLVRGRPTAPVAVATRLGRLAGFQPGSPLIPPRRKPRPWRVLPAGRATPGSRVMALVLTADRALAPATLYFPSALGSLESELPMPTDLTASDNLGTRYRLGYLNGTWTGSAWTGTIIIHPAPPAAARWLVISRPNDPVLRVELTAAKAGPTAHDGVGEPLTESPGERLLTRQAEAMLTALSHGYPAGHAPIALPDTVAILEAAGALSPLSPAPLRLAALGQLLGLPTHGPPDEVPARWTEVLARYGRRKQPVPVTGTAAIGAALPELDGARFAIAGLHSGASGTFLHILVQGLRPFTRSFPPGQPTDSGFSWWARDDAGGWHLGAFEDISPAGGPEGLLRLALLPPLGHLTATLTLQVSGLTQHATANLLVRW